MAKKQHGVAAKISKSNKRKKIEKRKVAEPKRKRSTRYASRGLVGLEKRFFSKVKQEFHDIDYVDQLGEKDRKFMSTFMEESLGANLSHPGKKLHKTKAERKLVFDANNARQRDIYAQMRASGRMVDIDPDIAIEALQMSHYDMDADSKELEVGDFEILTKREFLQLIKNGANVPQEFIEFYKKLYKII